MRLQQCSHIAALALWAISIEAAEFKKHDGIHRLAKKAQITGHAVLGRRDDSCGTSAKLCPSSMNGGCCPEDYDCAKESCYATTKGPSTCLGQVGWHACQAKFGGGCCPDGYLCQTGGDCVPPSGSAYTFGCPTGHSLCPSSMNYGCCPNGMGCAKDQCYSTEAQTITTTMDMTTTDNGKVKTYETTVTTVKTVDPPTSLPTANSGNDDENQRVLKYFPSAVAKFSPTSSASSDDGSSGGGGGSGLSKGALGGIIAGAVAFLIIILVAAFIIIRHLNKVVAAVGSSRQSNSTKSRPPMKEFKPTDSEVDAFSVDPLMATPRPTVPRYESSVDPHYGMSSPEYYSSNGPTPSIPDATAPQSVSGSVGNSRHTSFDVNATGGYFDSQGRFSQSGATLAANLNRISNDSRGAYAHVRHWSSASDTSEGRDIAPTPLGELEATPYVPELHHSSSNVVSPQERDWSNSTGSVMTRPPMVHQRKQSSARARGESLGVLNEELQGFHGFHGPDDHLVGQTGSHRPGTRATASMGVHNERPEGEEEHEQKS